MLWLSLQYLTVILGLFLLAIFEKVIGLPILFSILLAHSAASIPGFARISLVVGAAFMLASLFALPAYVGLLLVGSSTYGWITAERFASRSNVARVGVAAAASLIWLAGSGGSLSLGTLFYSMLCVVGCWVVLERTNYAL